MASAKIELSTRLKSFNLTEDDIEKYIKQERDFLSKREVSETDEDAFLIDYRHLLMTFWTVRYLLITLFNHCLTNVDRGKHDDAERELSNHGQTGHGPSDPQEVDRLRRKMRALMRSREEAKTNLLVFEHHHYRAVEDRPSMQSPEWKSAEQALLRRRYGKILDDLERALLMRYQELSRIKAGIGKSSCFCTSLDLLVILQDTSFV